MPRPETSRAGTAVGWLGRIALVLGGAAFAVRTALPVTGAGAQAAAPASDPLDDGDTGRGHPETPPSGSALRQGHETKDLNAGTLGRLVAGLGFVVVVVIFGIVGFRKLVTGVDQRALPPLTAQQLTPIQPPAPTLQAHPIEELAQLHVREDKLLTGYAWRDPEHTEARIPIDRAMKLIIGHPLDTAP